MQLAARLPTALLSPGVTQGQPQANGRRRFCISPAAFQLRSGSLMAFAAS